ncbi:MAG TPA: SLC13 family permease, partial [Streptosporangiaceae bacterium]
MAAQHRGTTPLTGAPAEALSAVLLAIILVTAVTRPRWLPDSVAAVAGAVIVIAAGVLPLASARSEAGRLLPVVGFLAAVLVLGQLCEAEGLFTAAGARLARWSGRDPVRLLTGTFALASATTAVLSLDTTVVLLTPVVHDTTARLRLRPRPPVYACAHLANSASLLLPVSNLTNLLAFAVVPVSFSRFAALMVLPWLVAIVVETAGARTVFRSDFMARLSTPADKAEPFPVVATTVVGLTVVGFAVGSLVGIAPVWVATAGAVVLAGYRLAHRRTTVVGVVRSASPSFCLFVFGLGIVVSA